VAAIAGMENIYMKDVRRDEVYVCVCATYDVDYWVEIDQEHDGWDQVCNKSNDEETNSLVPKHPPQA